MIGTDDSDYDSDDIDIELEIGNSNGPVEETVPGDPTDGDETNRVCVERWKANADDSKKGMFSCFEESGLFVAVCRHGLLISCCDMVESGEL